MKTLVLNQRQTKELKDGGVVLVKRPYATYVVERNDDGIITAKIESAMKVIDEWRNMDDKTIRLTRKEHDELVRNGSTQAQRNGKSYTITLDLFGAPQVMVDQEEIRVLTAEEVE